MAGAHTLAPPKHEYRFDRRVSRPANDQPESHQETEPMSRHHSGHPTALLLLALGLIAGATPLGGCNEWFALGCTPGPDSGDPSGGVTGPLRILVSNDDGVHAEGIDVLVAALAGDPAYEVTVYAPAIDQSGSGDSDQCGTLSQTATTTLSGYPAVGVDGCPADAVTRGLAHMNAAGAPPHLVVTGINAGQNVSILVAQALSGTVGAAKTAVRAGIPALAVSQALPEPHDFASGATAAVTWIEEHREELLDGTAPLVLTNMNVPTCAPGTSIRGTIDDLPLALNPLLSLAPSNCASWLVLPPTDGIALQSGFISISEVWVP